MSVHHNAVDIPVTDLDEDDDILFGETHTALHDVSELDFERPRPKLATRIKNWFANPTQNSYEMVNFDDLGSSDSLELHKEPTHRLLRRRSRLLISFGSLVLIALVGGIFYMFGKISGSNQLDFKLKLSNSTHDFYPTTIVVSLDGFHPHYINQKRTPALHKMMVNDYGAPYMIPSFPSSTFPNHWTLVTGLYPSEHGIVGNTFYDPRLKKQFVNTDPKNGGLDPDFWHGGEPVWKTAHNHGVKSAIHMWPGSEVPGVGIDNGPLQVDRYNGSETLSSKVHRVLSWLDRELEDRPELILTYVPTIDLVGHKYGISGEELEKSLQEVDNFVETLSSALRARNLGNIVNLMVLSDHGMAPTSNDRLLYLDDIVDLDKIEHVDGWPLFGLRPKDDYGVHDAYEDIKAALKGNENFTLYKVDEFPPEWNFGAGHQFSYRLAPLWIVPEIGYAVTTHKSMEENNNQYLPKGVHGYNNTELLMRALFLGQGPYFRSLLGDDKKVAPFANTEVYGMICESLYIAGAPNNGSHSYLSNNLLRDHWKDTLDYPSLPFEIEHLVSDATYDKLYRWKSDGEKPEEEKPEEEKPSSSANAHTVTVTEKPKPTATKASHWPWFHFGEGLKHLGQEIEEGVEDVVEDVEDTLGGLFGDRL